MATNRFIPVRTGNTPPRSMPASAAPVHPRAGGEHLWDAQLSAHAQVIDLEAGS